MADDKTEKATPKRRDEARKEGNVPRSVEVNSAVSLIVGFLILSIAGKWMWGHMAYSMRTRLAELGHLTREPLTPDIAMRIGFDAVQTMLTIAIVPAGILTIAGVLASALQVKPQITPEALKPKFKRINPISGFKQKFSMSSLFELGKNIFKLVVVGAPAGWLLWSRRAEILALGDAEPLAAGHLAASLAIAIGLRVGSIYIVLAIIDWIYQRYNYEKKLRMSMHEVRQEARQQELAPELKSAQRRRQREAARRRMMQDVPSADVIITNPTHYAVALKYDTDIGAPQVVAKGVDLLALKIREIGEASGVVRFENRELARDLYASVEVGNVIPAELYTAVAEVLAFVYKTNDRHSSTLV